MKKTNVYILTRESKAYSDEGLRYVTEMLKTDLNETDELTFCMGAVYNNPGFLREQIMNDEKCYVVVSSDKGIVALTGKSVKGGPGVKGLQTALSEFPKNSSWEIAHAILDKEWGEDWSNRPKKSDKNTCDGDD